MSLLKTAVAAAALTIAGQMAGASTFLDYQGLAGFGPASVWGRGPDYSGKGGAFRMHDAADGLGLGNDFIAFCVDLAGIVGDDHYYINNDAPFDPERKLTDFQKSNVENLFQASYAHVDVYDNIELRLFNSHFRKLPMKPMKHARCLLMTVTGLGPARTRSSRTRRTSTF